VKKMKI